MTRPKSFARWQHRPATRVAVVASVALSLVLTSCSSGGSGGGGGKSSGGTVKIGVINTFGQGAQSESADDQYDGMQLGKKYIAEHGGLYNGASIDFVQGNENGQAALVATTARKMVGQGVKLVIGPALTPDCLAAGPILDSANAVSLVSCTTTSLTGKDRQVKNLYRWDTNDQITSTALGIQIANKFKDVSDIDVVAYDYLQGHQGWDTFRNTLKTQGITDYTTTHEFFVPSGTTNYSSQISALAQTPADGRTRVLVLLTWGAGYLNFLQQAAPLDFLKNYSAVVTTSMYYKSAVALKGQSPQIFNSYGTCYASLWKNDIMNWFTEQMKSTYNRLPDDWSTLGFNQVLAMAAAINKAKSTDSADVNKAMASLTFDSANGKQTMDADTHQATRDTPVCETVGDASSPEGVKLVQGTILTPDQLKSAFSS